MNDKTIIASLGGGFTSSALMPRLLLDQKVEFLNCVLPNEHPDTWKLFDAVEDKLGIKITYIAYCPNNKWQVVDKVDRTNASKLWTPFKIFMEQGFIGNSRNDPCSRMLKREVIFNYVNDLYTTENCKIAVGIHSEEIERHVAIRQNWQSKGYEVIFPIMGDYKHSREEELALLDEWYGVTLDLYQKDFEHNNCAGACVKAGQRQWALLWYHYPEVYQEWEQQEAEWNKQWAEIRGKNYYILRRQVAGVKEYLSLAQFRKNVIEPAMWDESATGFLATFLQSLPSNPACMWCSSI